MLERISQSALGYYLTLALLALALPTLLGSNAVATSVLILAIAVGACNLMLGYAGLLSFAQGAFFGVGSYVAGLALKTWPALDALAILACVAAGALAALLVGLLSIRQRGIYFIMITLAMAQLAYFLALSLPQYTGGENGLIDLARPGLGAQWLESATGYYIFVATLFLACFAFLRRLIRSPFGKLLDALRENELRAESIGYNVQLLKLVAFCLSGALSALAGGLYAWQVRAAPLSNIDLTMSESLLVMAILGGRRSMIGAVFGALAMTLMSEYLSQLWPRWQLIVGIVLIAVVLFAPNGLGGLWNQIRLATDDSEAGAGERRGETT